MQDKETFKHISNKEIVLNTRVASVIIHECGKHQNLKNILIPLMTGKNMSTDLKQTIW